MPLESIHQVAVLEVQAGGICGHDISVAQRLTQAPHKELGWQTLYFGIGAVLQVVGQRTGVYLVSKLIAVIRPCKVTHTIGQSVLGRNANCKDQQQEEVSQMIMLHNGGKDTIKV